MSTQPFIIDLLDELDLDIQGFHDSDTPLESTSSLLFAGNDEALLDNLALFDDDLELEPRKWVSAGPPVWDAIPAPLSPRLKLAPLCQPARNLTIHVPPRSPSRPFAKENIPTPSPTERSFARLRDRGSSFALKALNSAFSSPDISHRVLI